MTEFPPPLPHDARVFTRAEVRLVDRQATEEYGIPGIVLMENAARELARYVIEADRFAGRSWDREGILVICGPGNNGGDGYALARHLEIAGESVSIAALGEPDAKSDAGINLAICQKMRIQIEGWRSALKAANVNTTIVDAVFGTGLDRPVTGEASELIDQINDLGNGALGHMIVAADIPSGLDCDTGKPLGKAVRARLTVTFAGIKAGFLVPESRDYVGAIALAHIGAPRELLERHGKPMPPA